MALVRWPTEPSNREKLVLPGVWAVAELGSAVTLDSRFTQCERSEIVQGVSKPLPSCLIANLGMVQKGVRYRCRNGPQGASHNGT